MSNHIINTFLNNSPTEKRPLQWSFIPNKAKDLKNIPTKRSGHSFSIIGNIGYLFGGCGENEISGPLNDIYSIKLGNSTHNEWYKIPLKSTEGPMARWKHSATVIDMKIWIFGGFHTDNIRLNDLWIFNPITMDWSQPIVPVTTTINETDLNSTPTIIKNSNVNSNAISEYPPPRGDHTATFINNNLYIFGGYGGTGHSRRDLDDLRVLHTIDLTWTKLISKGKAPEKRSGHQACGIGNHSLLIYGGWNHSIQFNDLYILDIENLIWSTIEGPHMGSIQPRYNHVSCLVPTFPYSKIFVFGGVLTDIQDPENQGTFMNDLCIFDTETNTWNTLKMNYPILKNGIIDNYSFPSPRSEMTLAYDTNGSRLVLFGGWANIWLNDLYFLDLGNIIGPSYTITGIHPDSGPINGGLEVLVEGTDFINIPPVTVRFSYNKSFLDVIGQYINQQVLKVKLPDFSSIIGANGGEVEVRIAFQDDLFTNTYKKFIYNSISL